MLVLGEIRQSWGRRRETRRFGTLFFLAFSFFMILFSLYGAQASVFEKARETVLDTFAPVLTVLNAPVRYVNNRMGGVDDYFRLRAENKRLRQENADLRLWMQEAMTLRRRIAYYETILDTQLPEPADYIDAQVIGENNGPYDHALIISAGRDTGVKSGSAVIDDGGLLGHVVTTGRDASRILLLTDYASSIPVVIEDMEIDALLSGRATSAPVLEFFETDDIGTIPPGTRLVTSGAGGVLPRGIAVGEVDRMVGGQIRVKLYSNQRTPDLVRVVDFDFPGVEVAETGTDD